MANNYLTLQSICGTDKNKDVATLLGIKQPSRVATWTAREQPKSHHKKIDAYAVVIRELSKTIPKNHIKAVITNPKFCNPTISYKILNGDTISQSEIVEVNLKYQMVRDSKANK